MFIISVVAQESCAKNGDFTTSILQEFNRFKYDPVIFMFPKLIRHKKEFRIAAVLFTESSLTGTVASGFV
jgi:hypothetical protein